jgi:hypothetical protein
MKHNSVLEVDDDTQIQRKQNHAILSCYVTRIAETTEPFLEIPWQQPNAGNREFRYELLPEMLLR